MTKLWSIKSLHLSEQKFFTPFLKFVSVSWSLPWYLLLWQLNDVLATKNLITSQNSTNLFPLSFLYPRPQLLMVYPSFPSPTEALKSPTTVTFVLSVYSLTNCQSFHTIPQLLRAHWLCTYRLV